MTKYKVGEMVKVVIKNRDIYNDYIHKLNGKVFKLTQGDYGLYLDTKEALKYGHLYACTYVKKEYLQPALQDGQQYVFNFMK